MKKQLNILWEDSKRTLFGLPLSFTKYRLTNDRLFIESGLLNRREDEVRLYRILDISLSRTLGQRLFGVGTIHCCSADKTLKDFDILNVKNPRDVKEQLSELVEQERMAKRVTNREFMTHDDMDDDHDDHDND